MPKLLTDLKEGETLEIRTSIGVARISLDHKSGRTARFRFESDYEFFAVTVRPEAEAESSERQRFAQA